MDFVKSYLVLLLIYVYNTNCFNLDVTIPIVKQGSPNSKFGFTVTQNNFRALDGTLKLKLLVGAPTDNNAAANIWNYNHLKSTGALYDCPYSYVGNDCKVIPFGRKDWFYIFEKDKNRYSNMFYGGAIASSKDVLMVCGYKFITNIGVTGRWARGYCQQMTLSDVDTFDFVSLSPCQSLPYESRGHTEYGMSQCGYSLAVDETSVLWGAPGSNNWRGAMFKQYSGSDEDPDNFNGYTNYLHTATAIADRNENITEKVPVDEFSYLGSSVCFGNIFNNEGRTTYITGAPRAKGYGKVLLFEKDRKKDTKDRYLTLRKELMGEQFGARFGDSVLAVDLNGDGKDDLIVGSPYYSESRVGGAVFIYYSDENGILFNKPNVTLKSRTMDKQECKRLNCEFAKFGYSLASINDIDNDGFQGLDKLTTS